MSLWYFIETSNGLALSLTDDGIILGWRSQVDSKLWRLDENGVIHSKTGAVIEIPGSNTEQGVGLMGSHDAHGGENQRFSFDGKAIRSHLNDFVFDVEEGLMEVGSALCMWPHQGGDNQTFTFVQVSTRRRARNLRASSDNVEVKITPMSEGIPEGWYQANVEEAEAHSELIVSKMGKWCIAELVGGWINGHGYGGNVEAKGPRDLGHRVLMRLIRQRPATSKQGMVMGYLPSGDNVPGYQGVSCDGPYDCVKMCADVNGCVGWTFQKSTNKCWLKTTNAGVIFNEDWISGGPSIGNDWEGVEITKKEMTNITTAIQVFGGGEMHNIKRIAKITKESFEDILKSVEDRLEMSRRMNEALTYTAERAKTRKRDMDADLRNELAQLNRRRNQLKRLEVLLESSRFLLRNSQRDLDRARRDLEKEKRAEANATTSLIAGGILSVILPPVGLAVVAGSGIAKGVIASQVSKFEAIVRSRHSIVGQNERRVGQAKADKAKSQNEVAKLQRDIDQLRRDLLDIKDKIRTNVIENQRCTSLLEEIRGVHLKVIEMENAANNVDRVSEKAFDMLQMAIPLNELLIALENNSDILDEGAKAELQSARFKFTKFKNALDAEMGHAVEF